MDSRAEVGPPLREIRESLVKLEVDCFGFCNQK